MGVDMIENDNFIGENILSQSHFYHLEGRLKPSLGQFGFALSDKAKGMIKDVFDSMDKKVLHVG